jgi:hypothetical protein
MALLKGKDQQLSFWRCDPYEQVVSQGVIPVVGSQRQKEIQYLVQSQVAFLEECIFLMWKGLSVDAFR